MVPEKHSYFSRFAVKFAEILGAGIATAVSGFLVAHLGGYLSWPAKPPVPTVAVEAPISSSARTPDRPRSRTTASAPAETHAASDDRAAEPPHAAAKPVEVSTPATTAVVPVDNDDKRSRSGVPSRKPVADAHAVKPAPHENAEAKAHDQEAVEDQVRAALANVDASRTPRQYAGARRDEPGAANDCNPAAAANSCAEQPGPFGDRPKRSREYAYRGAVSRPVGRAGRAAARPSKCRARSRDRAKPAGCRVSVTATNTSRARSVDGSRDKIPSGRRCRGHVAWRAGDGRRQQ